jgi:hypothetical protein
MVVLVDESSNGQLSDIIDKLTIRQRQVVECDGLFGGFWDGGLTV